MYHCDELHIVSNIELLKMWIVQMYEFQKLSMLSSIKYLAMVGLSF